MVINLNIVYQFKVSLVKDDLCPEPSILKLQKYHYFPVHHSTADFHEYYIFNLSITKGHESILAAEVLLSYTLHNRKGISKHLSLSYFLHEQLAKTSLMLMLLIT